MGVLNGSQTDFDNESLRGSSWKLTPYHAITLPTPPPPVVTHSGISSFDESADRGKTSLVQPTYTGVIDQELHKSLLNQSMQEYAHIWNLLADM